MGFDSQNSFGWECKPRSSLCTHAFHYTSWKDPDIHVLDKWMPSTQSHPTCTINEDGMWLPQWSDQKMVTNAQIWPKMVDPRDTAGKRRRRRRYVQTEASNSEDQQGWLWLVGWLVAQHSSNMLVYLYVGTDLLNCTCCHTEIEVADQTIHLTQSQ